MIFQKLKICLTFIEIFDNIIVRDSEKSCLSILFFLAALARRGNIGHIYADVAEQ